MHKRGPLRSGVFLVRFTTFIIALHVLQILLWAGFYRWLCFPLWESAFYFSTSSYATVGYGDVALPWMWRALGPVGSTIGVLLGALCAGDLFSVGAPLRGFHKVWLRDSGALAISFVPLFLMQWFM